jgi:hypothetical protein
VIESQTQVWLPQSVHLWRGLERHSGASDAPGAPPPAASDMAPPPACGAPVHPECPAVSASLMPNQALLYAAPAHDDARIARLPIQFISPGLPMAHDPASYQRYLTDMFRVARCLQVHQHTSTCWRDGLSTCRLAYGRMSWNSVSGPLQLDVSVRPPRPFAALQPVPVMDDDDPASNPWYPFPCVDPRIITYQQFRPVFGIQHPAPIVVAEDGVHAVIPPVSANSRVVSFLPALTFVTRGNNASYRLYSNSESIGAMAYMGEWRT